MKRGLISVALACVAMTAGCATRGAGAASEDPGQVALGWAFDPARIFVGDVRPSSDDQVVLEVSASLRDYYIPAYSLAIAYRCRAVETLGRIKCGYTARTLRVGPPGEGQFDRGLMFLSRLRNARTVQEMRPLMDGQTGLQWLEADVDACPQGIFAIDSVRVTNWRPDIHYPLQPRNEREIILHPAQIRVKMIGTYTTTTYQGWVLADGVPAAVRTLLDTLEPCWTPATSPKPWERGE